MDRIEVQRDVRGAIAIAYELSRHEHVQNKEHVAQALPLPAPEKTLVMIDSIESCCRRPWLMPR